MHSRAPRREQGNPAPSSLSVSPATLFVAWQPSLPTLAPVSASIRDRSATVARPVPFLRMVPKDIKGLRVLPERVACEGSWRPGSPSPRLAF